MRVLWVTPHHPSPTGGGGSSHEFALLRSAAAHHEIHVLSTLTSWPGESALAGIGVTYEVIESTSRPYPRNKAEVALPAMLRARPTLLLWVLRDRWSRLRVAIPEAERRLAPDLVHMSLGELAPALDAASAPTTLLLFDSYTWHVERRLEGERLPRRRAQLLVERRRAAAGERRWYREADGVCSVSEVDAAMLRQLLDKDVTVIENPIEDDLFEAPTVPRAPETVTFVGSLAYPPNTDAIAWLTEEIWPRVKAARPSVRLVVAGRGDGDAVTVPRVRDMVERAGGELHLDVPDIRPYYWEASVVIAPIRLGAGLRNKVIHAMACNAPVVATPVALEGVAVRPDEHVLASATATGLAEAVLATLDDPARAAARAGAAARAVEIYRADLIGERFDAWWRQTVERAS